MLLCHIELISKLLLRHTSKLAVKTEIASWSLLGKLFSVPIKIPYIYPFFIILYDFHGISEFLCPSLTTIASPLHEMAEKAVELVLRDDLRELHQIKMQVRLIERNSITTIL